MTETITTSVVGNIVPNFSVVEKSGFVFEWTWNDVKSLEGDIQVLIKSKVMPKPKFLPQRLLMLSYWLTVLGGLLCLPMIIALIRGEIQNFDNIIVAGMIFGATGVGVIFFVCLIIRARRMKRIKPLFESISYRVGVDRDSLWLFDGKALRVIANTSAFDSVIQIEDIILAYVTKTISYGFPHAKLNQDIEGKKVISWFETNWPSHTGVNAYRYKSLHRSWFRSVMKTAVNTICVVGFVVLIISLAVYAGNLWQEHNAAKAYQELSKRPTTDGQIPHNDADQSSSAHALSGPAARDFLDHLTNPNAK